MDDEKKIPFHKHHVDDPAAEFLKRIIPQEKAQESAKHWMGQFVVNQVREGVIKEIEKIQDEITEAAKSEKEELSPEKSEQIIRGTFAYFETLLKVLSGEDTKDPHKIRDLDGKAATEREERFGTESIKGQTLSHALFLHREFLATQDSSLREELMKEIKTKDDLETAKKALKEKTYLDEYRWKMLLPMTSRLFYLGSSDEPQPEEDFPEIDRKIFDIEKITVKKFLENMAAFKKRALHLAAEQ